MALHLSTFVKGALAGLAVGILIAPRKGLKTRKKLVEACRSIFEDAKEKASAFASDTKQEIVSLQ